MNKNTTTVTTTSNVAEAQDAVWEVRSAWDATPEAEDGDFASGEHEETSYVLDELELLAEEGVTEDRTWELTFPNGDELHLTLVRA